MVSRLAKYHPNRSVGTNLYYVVLRLFTAMQVPVFTKPLEGTQYVEPGVSHILECDAHGLPVPMITWLIDGSTIEEGDFDGTVTFNANKTR